MKRVVVSGYYGFNNAGDEAVLDGMLSALRRSAENKGAGISFTILSAHPAETSSRYGVNAIGRTRIFEIIRAVARCDLFISGGGGLLQDMTGLKLSVAYYLGLVLLARLMGKKAILYAHGIGPVTRPLNRMLVRLIANRVTAITVRDQGSLEELARMGVENPPISLTADTAFLLSPSEDSAGYGDLLSGLPAGWPRIGVAVRAWKNKGRYLPEIAAAVNTLTQELGASVLLIPMYYSEDLPVCRELAGMLRNRPAVLEKNLPPRELLGLFTRLDMVLAVRLHALIFAAIAGVPMVGVGYDPKVDAFLRRLGFATAGETGEVKAPEIVGQALTCWQKRAQIRGTLLQKSEELRKEAAATAAAVVDTLLKSGDRS